MKLRHFREIVAIAERGSIRGAARHLRMAQPVLTRSLAEFEREVGAPLFERRPRGVVATPLGQALLRRAASILEQVRRTEEEVAQLRGATHGTVTAGLSIAAHLALLPGSLRRFRARYEQSKLHIIEGFYPTLETGLRTGGVDFYIGPEPTGALAPELTSELLFANRRTVLCRVGHPLAGARSLGELVGADWATTSITLAAGDELGVVFARHGLPAPNLALRSQSAPVQWSQFTVTRGALTTIPVAEELAAPSIVVIRRVDLPLTPAARFFLDLMCRSAPERCIEVPPSTTTNPMGHHEHLTRPRKEGRIVLRVRN